MEIAALILWIVAAGGGSFLLATWIAKGGARRQPGDGSRFPPGLIFGHFALAAVGLIVWIIYIAVDSTALAWIAFALLAVVAVLGFSMFARWVPTYREHQRRAVPAGGVAVSEPAGPAERHFPVPVVGAHGLLAAATLVLVLLTALGVGGS